MKRKNYWGYAFTLLALATILASIFSVSFVLAKGTDHHTSSVGISGIGQPVSTPAVAMHVVDMQQAPSVANMPVSHLPPQALPVPAWNPNVYKQLKTLAAHNNNAPVASTVQSALPNATGSVDTPTVSKKFQGMADSASICPPLGCQPPDQALAASTSWVLQGVNTSFAVYSTAGTLQSGWPKSAQSFFGVPNPGSCDPNGPYLTDPRAFYDPNDGRFWTAILQVEGVSGRTQNCPFLTRYWIAVSQTSDPRGLWNIYAFDMSGGTTNDADYTMFGFDQQAIYFSGNMFNQALTAYEYAEIFGVNKSLMEAGSSVTAFGFRNLSVTATRTVLVDTVQPVETEARKYGGPNGGVFINSFNGGEVHQFNGDPFGDDCISSSCHGLAVWTMTKPGTSSATLSFTFVDTAHYILPPSSDEPGCTQCVDSLDTRVSGTPPYHNGDLSFALETGVNNGSQIVPAILWGQVVPAINDDGTLAGATLFQQGYYAYAGDTSASFGALMPDADGDLFMVFELMSSSIKPEVVYTARRVALSLGIFHDGGIVLRAGNARTTNFRWGDYEATSYDGFSSNKVWFAGEYSPSNGDWSTFIGKDQFCATCN